MIRYLMLLAVATALLAACGSPAAPSANSPATAETGAAATVETAGATAAGTAGAAAASTAAATAPAGAATALAGTAQKVTVGLGYIPNVQFAPFYVAQSKGYYAAEGLSVDFSYGGNVNDLLVQSAAGKLPFVVAAGDEILLARAQQVPVEMVFLLYQKMPVAVFSKQAAGIRKPEDLKGKVIGIPGRYGATYIGLRGLLYAAGLSENDVSLSEIGFAQFEAVSGDKVPAAVGYASNEPLRMAAAGSPVNVIKVADYIKLVNNGVVVSETYARDHPDTVQRFVRATRKGLQDTLANPDEAFKIALTFIPELKADQQPFQRKVLDDTLSYWRTTDTDAHGLGWLNPPAWEETYTFLRKSGILTKDVEVGRAYSEAFLK